MRDGELAGKIPRAVLVATCDNEGVMLATIHHA